MIIIDGLSGAGKRSALNALEDMGYQTIHHFPAELLDELPDNERLAVSLSPSDAPNEVSATRIFLEASEEILLKRYGEARRPHPIQHLDLIQAIQYEKQLLAPIRNQADFIIDTSQLSIYDLKKRLLALLNLEEKKIKINLASFGFKYGLPSHADFVFDVRFLPNPYWEVSLRNQTGKDRGIIEFFQNHPIVDKFIQNTSFYLKEVLNDFMADNNRAYLNIYIGCTGGKHRSVYVTEQIGQLLKSHCPQLNIHHRELNHG